MSMPGLKLNIFRMIGKVLNLIAVIMMLISFWVYYEVDFMFPKLFTTIGVAFLIGQFYIEKDFWDEHRHVLMLIIILVFYVWPNLMIGIMEIEKPEYIIYLMMFAGAPILGVFFQQASLSIYRKEKLLFIIFFGTMQLILTLWQILIDEMIFPLVITSQILMLVGFILVLLIENILRKKKLLNYIK